MLGSSCNYGHSIRDLRSEDLTKKVSEKQEASTKTEMKVIKFNEPGTVAPMAGIMGEAVVPATVGGGGSGVYKNAERPSQLPNPNTTSRIGIRRSTSGQRGISPTTLPSTPTRSSLPSVLPSSSPSSNQLPSPFKKERVLPCTPIKSFLEIVEAPELKKVEVIVNIFEEPKPTGAPNYTLKVPGKPLIN